MLIGNLVHQQVGLDAKAQAFLSRLDNDSKVGKMVDCTSAYELEQEEYLQRSGESFCILTHSHATPLVFKMCACLLPSNLHFQSTVDSQSCSTSFCNCTF